MNEPTTRPARNVGVKLRIRSLASLFDALDPAPLHQRALNRDAGRYILGSAGTDRSTEPLRLLIHLSESLRADAADASDAIHEHFRRALERGERRFRRRQRIGGVTLGVALGVLAGSFWLRSLLRGVEGRALVQGIGELASIPIEFVFLPGTSRQEDGLPDDR